MEIKHKIPEIYYKCREVFGNAVDWDKGIILTYGDSVYSKFDIPDHLEIHEGTHIKQQGEYGVEKWWERYFIDKEFRLSQEVEAYRNQHNFLKEKYPRQQRRVIMRQIYKDMARLYGDMCTEEEAENLLNT